MVYSHDAECLFQDTRFTTKLKLKQQQADIQYGNSFVKTAADKQKHQAYKFLNRTVIDTNNHDLVVTSYDHDAYEHIGKDKRAKVKKRST